MKGYCLSYTLTFVVDVFVYICVNIVNVYLIDQS